MEQQKRCKYCRYYNAFYVKNVYSFGKHKAGFCTQQQKAVYENDKCGLYKYKPQEEKTVTLEHLEIVINDLETLERIFYNCDT